jgi:(p)ppGpp synthase/HD superfamily hydrolase
MLGREFEDAVRYACILHADQSRKGTSTPYVAHLLAVTALVLEDGGGEQEAIAALLHDAVEDRGGRARLEDIERRFGASVAQMVLDCSDWTGRPGQPKQPWWERKLAYIAHLPAATPGGLRVSLADKVANARAIVRDARLARERGEEDAFWTRFSTRAPGQLWYFRSLLVAFREAVAFPTALLPELEELVSKLEEVVPAAAHEAQAELPPTTA